MTQINPTPVASIPLQAPIPTVTIPAGGYVEVDTVDGAHLAVYATREDSEPVLRIRIGAGPLNERVAVAEDVAYAATRLHTLLINAGHVRGGAA